MKARAARLIVAGILAALGCPGTSALAQSSSSMSETEFSKVAENPVSRWITVPLRYEAEFDDGAYRAVKDTFKVSQAIVPFQLNEDWALITRTNIPLEVQPPKKGGEHWNFGLADSYTTFFLSPEHGKGFYWGLGPVLYYPTATNHALGVNHWGSGASGAVGPDLRPGKRQGGRDAVFKHRRARRVSGQQP